jgi:hypothetical protein
MNKNVQGSLLHSYIPPKPDTPRLRMYTEHTSLGVYDRCNNEPVFLSFHISHGDYTLDDDMSERERSPFPPLHAGCRIDPFLLEYRSCVRQTGTLDADMLGSQGLPSSEAHAPYNIVSWIQAVQTHARLRYIRSYHRVCSQHSPSQDPHVSYSERPSVPGHHNTATSRHILAPRKEDSRHSSFQALYDSDRSEGRLYRNMRCSDTPRRRDLYPINKIL